MQEAVTARAYFVALHMSRGDRDLARVVLTLPDWCLWPYEVLFAQARFAPGQAG